MLNKVFTRRIFVLSVLKLFLFLTIVVRLFYLQIKENQYFSNLSNKNRTSYIPIIPKRGIIFDYFKKPLASNILIWEALFIKSSLTKPIDSFLTSINTIIKLTNEEKEQIIKNYNKAYTYDSILIKSKLTEVEIATIETYHSLFPEIFIAAGYTRAYLYPEAAAHVIGYIGAAKDKTLNKNIANWYLGKQGVELSLDSILKGDVGYTQYEVNAKGKVLKKLGTISTTSGQNITLTIDIVLQNYIYNLIKNLSAAAVVLDIGTGEVLASVSSSSFNPNQLTYGISTNEWNNIINNPENPLNDRAVAGLYPPASTIKPFIAMMALEKNIITPKTKIECKGYIDIGNRRFHCWLHSGHGLVNVSQALTRSCDVFFYTLGIQMQREDFRQLGEILQINNNLLPLLPSSSKGNLPLKQNNPPLGELAIAAIGQGEWLTTPLHIANMAAILGASGIIKEIKLLKEMDYKNKVVYSKPNKVIGSLPFSSKYITLMQNAMDKVVKSSSNTVWPLSGKTGTAQVVRITQEQRLKGLTVSNIRKYREHAVFMGYLPSFNPQYALSVVVEHVGFASIHAVPIAKKIAATIYERHSLYEQEKQRLKGILDAS